MGDYSREVGSAPRIPAAPVEDTSLQEFRQQIETNLFGTIIMTKALLGHFREQRAGVILRISSIAGRVGPTGRAPYAAAKFGVEGFSEALARDVGPLGIKVVIVEPGGFRTDFAGSSTNLYARHPEYSETVGATVRFQQNFNGKQPGDPKKAAQLLLRVGALDKPPIRIAMGGDVYKAAEQVDNEPLELSRRFKDWSCSTDFDN